MTLTHGVDYQARRWQAPLGSPRSALHQIPTANGCVHRTFYLLVVPVLGLFLGDFVHRASRSYYLFFNYLSYYLYVLPVWYKNRGGGVTRLVQNYPF